MRLFTRERPHEARFYAPAVFYTYAFSLPIGTDIYRLSDRLLHSGIAEAAIASDSSQARIGQGRAAVLKYRVLSESLAELDAVVREDIKFRTWALRHPRAAVYALRHNMLRFRLRKGAKNSGTDRDFLRATEELRDQAKRLDELIMDDTKLIGALGAIDRDLFAPGYLNEVPFIRLELKKVLAISDSLADTEILVFLLLHKSGTALLSFAAVPGFDCNTDELLRVSIGRPNILSSTFIAEAVLGPTRPSAEDVIEDEWIGEQGKERYRRNAWRIPLSVTDLYYTYNSAIRRHLKRHQEFEDFVCYSTLFVGGLRCCGRRDRWLRLHDRELAGLITRHPAYGRMTTTWIRKTIEMDFSLHTDESRYYEANNAVVVDWEFDESRMRTSFTDYAMTIGVIENVLLQSWQIQSLDKMLGDATSRGTSLSQIERALAEGLQEYRRPTMVWGTAQQIATHILDSLNTDAIYERLRDRLELLKQLAETRQARASDRRNILLAGASAAAAVVFGLPAIRDSLRIVGSIKPDSHLGRAIEPIRAWAATSGPSAVVTVYILLLVGFIMMILLTFVRRPDRRPTRRKDFGIEWTSCSPQFEATHPEYKRGHPIEDRDGGQGA